MHALGCPSGTIHCETFAINARTTQARGIAWQERATEIAKLTVLETEFPLFAADLHIEPRLPSLVLFAGRVQSVAKIDQRSGAGGLVPQGRAITFRGSIMFARRLEQQSEIVGQLRRWRS